MLPRHEIATYVVNTVKLLLNINPDSINFRDYKGYNALWYAVLSFGRGIHQYYDDVLKALLEYPIDACSRDEDGKNMLYVQGFTQHGQAIDQAIIERLVALGANIEDVDILGNTPVNQMATNLRQVAAVQALLTCGVSMKVRNLKGDTPLYQAAKGRVFPLQDEWDHEQYGVPLDAKIRRQDEMMKVLEEGSSGLDVVNTKNADGKTAAARGDETNGA